MLALGGKANALSLARPRSSIGEPIRHASTSASSPAVIPSAGEGSQAFSLSPAYAKNPGNRLSPLHPCAGPHTERPSPLRAPVMLSRPFTRPTGAQGPLCPILSYGRFAPCGLPYLIFAPFPHGCFSLTKKRQASPALSRAGPAIPLCPSPLYRPSPLPRGGPKAEPLPRRC